MLPPVSFEAILRHEMSFPDGECPLALFDEYIKSGYYPFWGETDYTTRLKNASQSEGLRFEGF